MGLLNVPDWADAGKVYAESENAIPFASLLMVQFFLFNFVGEPSAFACCMSVTVRTELLAAVTCPPPTPTPRLAPHRRDQALGGHQEARQPGGGGQLPGEHSPRRWWCRAWKAVAAHYASKPQHQHLSTPSCLPACVQGFESAFKGSGVSGYPGGPFNPLGLG